MNDLQKHHTVEIHHLAVTEDPQDVFVICDRVRRAGWTITSIKNGPFCDRDAYLVDVATVAARDLVSTMHADGERVIGRAFYNGSLFLRHGDRGATLLA